MSTSAEVVWITGGGSGLGRAMALHYATRGARVALSGRRLDRLEEVAAEVRAAGGEALALALDVTDEAATQAVVDAIIEAWGRLDISVANAGCSISGRVSDLEAADWRRQLEVNVVGSAITARASLPHLHATKGRLALVGSVAAWLGIPSSAAYCASKAAIRTMGMSLSAELAGTGVSCTTLHPGFVESEIAQVDNAGIYHPDRKDPRPARLLWKTDRAARVMVGAIDRRRGQFVFTGHGRIAVMLGQYLPGLAHWIIGRSAIKANRRRLARATTP